MIAKIPSLTFSKLIARVFARWNFLYNYDINNFGEVKNNACLLCIFVSISFNRHVVLYLCISPYKNEISVSHRIKHKQIVISMPSDDLTSGFAKIIMYEWKMYFPCLLMLSETHNLIIITCMLTTFPLRHVAEYLFNPLRLRVINFELWLFLRYWSLNSSHGYPTELQLKIILCNLTFLWYTGACVIRYVERIEDRLSGIWKGTAITIQIQKFRFEGKSKNRNFPLFIIIWRREI